MFCSCEILYFEGEYGIIHITKQPDRRHGTECNSMNEKFQITEVEKSTYTLIRDCVISVQDKVAQAVNSAMVTGRHIGKSANRFMKLAEKMNVPSTGVDY